MPGLLLQILLTPFISAAVVFFTRRWIGRWAGWLTAGTLFYTTLLVVFAGFQVVQGQVLSEEYLIIAPAIRLGLLADGLSLPTLAVILLLCTTLAVYSIGYIKHRIEVLYQDQSLETQTRYYVRFFYLLPFFPAGFIGTVLSTKVEDHAGKKSTARLGPLCAY